MHENVIHAQGIVLQRLRDKWFLVELDRSHRRVKSFLSGKILHRGINVLPGDRVDLEFDINGMDHARIVYRYK